MRISPKTKIDDLIKKYPFLPDFLSGLSPKFEKLKNPILRRTVGRVANLGQVAGLADFPLERLLAEIASGIRKRTNDAIEVETEAQAEKQFLTREERIEVLKDIIRDLHRGEDIELLRRRFADLIKDVSSNEISEMEQELIQEGMPVEEVMRLCDLHVQVFKDKLDERVVPQSRPGHPIHTLMEENRALEKIIRRITDILDKLGSPADETLSKQLQPELEKELEELAEVEKHYLKKENQLFPLLETEGIGGPSKVMWGLHDDIRARLRDWRGSISSGKSQEVIEKGRTLLATISDMIYKEEKILFPLSLESVTEQDWGRVKRGEEEVGYAWIRPGTEWKSPLEAEEQGSPVSPGKTSRTSVDLDTGALTLEQINLLLTHLPLDLSFADANDTVVYYSKSRDRIFPRSPAVIGRKVQNCHPPQSLHIVDRILDAFKAGQKEAAEFWIQIQDKFIHIRYFAVRDTEGRYQGCLEVSQDVTDIRKLEGNKRLLDWE